MPEETTNPDQPEQLKGQLWLFTVTAEAEVTKASDIAETE